MTFREESERMFVGVLVAAVLHGALLIVGHRLFDLRIEDYTRPLTVQLLAPETRGAPVRDERPVPPKQEETAPAVAVPRPAPQPVATPQPAADAQPAPERSTAQEPAPVRTQPRSESAAAADSSGPVAAWTPALRQSVESAPVRGRGGLNAVAGDVAAQAESPAHAATAAPAPFAGQGDLPTTFKDGLALPADESVYARSASSRTPGDSAAQGLGADDSVPVVRDPGLSGRSPQTAAALAPVRMSGTPTARRADAAGTGAGAAERAAPIADFAPGAAARPAPVDATVYGGAAASPSDEAAGVGSRLPDLDRALRASGRDSTASTGQDRGASTAADGAAGPATSDARLPDGWNVSGSLGLRPLLNVVDPALPERYPDEIVRSTVRVRIRVDPQGWVKIERFETDSGSVDLNNEITETLRQWRYEPVTDEQPVYGVVTIEIRIRSAEVAVRGP